LLVGHAAFACVAVLVQQHPGQQQGFGALFLLAFVQRTALVQWLLQQVAAGGDFGGVVTMSCVKEGAGL
jgi:hypothetical protein